MSYNPEEILEDRKYRASLTKPYVEEPDMYPKDEFTKLTIALSKKHSHSTILNKEQAKDVISCLSSWLEESNINHKETL